MGVIDIDLQGHFDQNSRKSGLSTQKLVTIIARSLAVMVSGERQLFQPGRLDS